MAKSSHNIFHYLFTIFHIFLKSVISSLAWILVGATGYFIYHSKKTPYDIVAGIPLMLIGGGLLLNNFGDVVNSVFSPKYNNGVCIFCSK